MEEFGVTNPLTKLVVELNGVHPDEAFSFVPYERGAALLFALETALGGAGEAPHHLFGFCRLFLYEKGTQCVKNWKVLSALWDKSSIFHCGAKSELGGLS